MIPLFRLVLVFALGLALILPGTPPVAKAAEATKPIALGTQVANTNSLRDVRGNRRPLHDFKNHSAIVLVFLGTDCPVSNLYVPRVLALEKKYRAHKVQFLGVYANEGEDLDQIAVHAGDRDLPFPVLKDCGQKLADQLGVTRGPAVVVLDENFSLKYRGRIDDRYGVAVRRPQASRDDLGEALEDVLAGKKVRVAETEADGCLIDHGRSRAVPTTVTYSKDVAPILRKQCQVCHRPEQNAPFSLLTYDDAVKHGRMLREVTSQRRMPPWHADERYGHFSNDRRLTSQEVQTLADWVDSGMPKGEEKDLPQPREWTKGWVHGKPDVVFTMPEEFEVPADGVMPYKNWLIDTHFTEDRWVRIAEAQPGSAAVVHHIVAYIMREGQKGPINADGSLAVLVGWAPGDLGLVCPPDTAMRIPKGARLRLEMHYTPNGKAVKDRSSIGITFAPKPPRFELFMSEFANVNFEVPAGEPHFKAEATMRFPADARLISLAPHMHWRGQDYRYEVIYPDGKHETILSVPRWDFNWQNVYRFQEPLKLPKGSRIHSVAHWDNSPNNLLNPDPTKSAKFGLQTWEEMMVGFAAYVWERPETSAELAKNPPSQADQLFDRLDTNADDFITRDEIPERMKPLLLLTGTALPEKLSRAEFKTLYDDMRKRMQSKKKD